MMLDMVSRLQSSRWDSENYNLNKKIVDIFVGADFMRYLGIPLMHVSKISASHHVSKISASHHVSKISASHQV